jgi:hypothetical protein
MSTLEGTTPEDGFPTIDLGQRIALGLEFEDGFSVIDLGQRTTLGYEAKTMSTPRQVGSHETKCPPT